MSRFPVWPGDNSDSDFEFVLTSENAGGNANRGRSSLHLAGPRRVGACQREVAPDGSVCDDKLIAERYAPDTMTDNDAREVVTVLPFHLISPLLGHFEPEPTPATFASVAIHRRHCACIAAIETNVDFCMSGSMR